MEPWIERQFGSVAAVREQTIVRITNRLTLESAIFNPLRARRPMLSQHDDAALEAQIAAELAQDDIFHRPLDDTTADLFGRIRGRFCVSASNVAKYEGWHGLVIFDQPHPLRFECAQLHDYIDVAFRWLAAAHAHDPQARYPLITWNCLPKSGATLMHGHMQIVLGQSMHYARVESWRRAAERYRQQRGRAYIDDLFAIHQQLGLAIRSGERVRACAHLTPLRNHEIILFADPGPAQDWETMMQAPGDHGRVAELADALYNLLRALIDSQGMRAFNLAIALPPFAPTAEAWHEIPIIARIADRGDPLTLRNDWGAMELFAAGCVVADPFEIAAQLRQSWGAGHQPGAG